MNANEHDYGHEWKATWIKQEILTNSKSPSENGLWKIDGLLSGGGKTGGAWFSWRWKWLWKRCCSSRPTSGPSRVAGLAMPFPC